MVEQEWIPPKPIEAEGVGIDVGLTCFVALSTGEKIKAPKPLSKKLNKLKRLSKQHSRKEKGSKNRKKSALKLARLHRKIRNIRHDFLHQTTTKLAKTKSVLAVEDLDVKGMMNKGLGRQISDVSWSAFYRMLEYKSEWYGSKVIKAPRFFPSSKICSECHIIVEHMPLELRRWTCPCCKKNHDRDINAAINLINYATGSSPGSYACGDPSGGGTGNWSTSYGSLKQELTNGIFVHNL